MKPIASGIVWASAATRAVGVSAVATSALVACGARSGLDSSGSGTPCLADTQRDSNNCGRCGHNCCGGDCVGGACQPVTIASGESYPGPILTAGANVYWGESGADAGRVFVCAKIGCGSGPAIFAGDQHYPDAFASDGENLYWTNRNGTTDRGEVVQRALDGKSAPVLLASHQHGPRDIAVDARFVYWVDDDEGTVSRCAIGGCGEVPTILASGLTQPRGIAVDATSVYYGAFNEVTGCALEGCATKRLVLTTTKVYSPWGMVVDAANAYWIDYTNGTVAACTKRGCADGPTIVYSTHDYVHPRGLAADATTLYWANAYSTTVMACAKSGCGGSPVVLARGQGSPLKIAVDDACVYWTNSESGEVMKVAKP
jgi:hypothetical protein